YVLLGAYLLLHPPMTDPRSTAVALGGGLFLLLFKSLPPSSFSILGYSWVGFLLYALTSSTWSLVPGLSLQSSAFLFLGTLLYLMGRAGDRSASNWIET